MLRRRSSLFSRQEVDGLIVLLMRIDANLARLVRAVEEGDGEEES